MQLDHGMFLQPNFRHATKRGAGRLCGADLNGDNLRIYTAHLQISDHCRVTVRVRAGFRVRVLEIWLGLVLGLALVLGLLSVVNKLLEKSDKMRINNVIKTGQLRSAPLRILSCPLTFTLCSSNSLPGHALPGVLFGFQHRLFGTPCHKQFSSATF